MYTVALDANGKLFAWGSNNFGQLGTKNVTATASSIPVEVDLTAGGTVTGLTIAQVDAGSGAHGLAIDCNGFVWSWGSNANGQVGVPPSNAVPNLTRVNTIGCGGKPTPTQPTNYADQLGNAIGVSGGNDESFALLANGTVVGWGQNDKGQLGRGITGNSAYPCPDYVKDKTGTPLRNIIQVDAGDENGYAVAADGSVWSWGGYEPSGPALGRNCSASAVACYGYADKVTKVDGSPLTGIVSIAAGDRHVLALDMAGRVWSWGGDWGPGQLGQGVNYQVATGASLVVGIGGTGFLSNVISIAAGQAHSVAALSDGSVVTWGANCFFTSTIGSSVPSGQLGQNIQTSNCGGTGNMSSNEYPMYAKDCIGRLFQAGTNGNPVKSVAVGDGTSFLIDSKNRIFAAGYNQSGELGLGNTLNRNCMTEFVLPGSSTLADPCPKIELGPDTLRICATNFPFPLEVPYYQQSANYTYKWYFRKGNPSWSVLPATTAKITVNDVGQYKVEVDKKALGCDCPTSADSIAISTLPVPFIAKPGTYCQAPVSFEVAGSGNYKWFKTLQSTTVLGTGNTITVPLSQANLVTASPDTVYSLFVEDVTVNTTNVGLENTASAQALGNPPANTDETKMRFKTFNKLTINSVTIYPMFASTNTVSFTFVVRDVASNKIVDTKSHSYTPQAITTVPSAFIVPLGLEVPIAGNYQLEYTTGPNIMFYDKATYPYVSNPIGIEILGPSEKLFLKNGITLFNWSVSIAQPYPCGRLEVKRTKKCDCLTEKPTILQSGLLLSSSEDNYNQWYLNGAAINGATNKTWEAQSSGNYKVVVTVPNCSALQSDAINVVVTGIEDADDQEVGSVYPSPFQQRIHFKAVSAIDHVLLKDGHGKNVFTDVVENAKEGELHHGLEKLSAGIYTIELHLTNGTVLRKKAVKVE